MNTNYNGGVNLKQFGAAALAAIALSGAVTSCSVSPEAKQVRSIAKTTDKLAVWVESAEHTLPTPTAWGLVVHRIVDVRKEFEADILGVAMIRNDEPCFALLSKKNEQGQIAAVMFSRHNNAYTAWTEPLDKDMFTTWILTNGLECAAEAVKKP